MDGKGIKRVVGVDILRGITIFLMIFANYGFLNSPWFMRHFQPYDTLYGVTYVDFIFPMFLLLIGISIPLAFRKYQELSYGPLRFGWHALLRGVSMLGIGVLILNAPDTAVMGSFPWLHGFWSWANVDVQNGAWGVWRILVMLAVMVLFHQIKSKEPVSRCARRISMGLKILAGLFLVYYCCVFQEHSGGWFKSGWWEIIGLLGWAYMVASLFWILLYRYKDMLFLAVLFLIAYTAAVRGGNFQNYPFLMEYLPFLGSSSILTMIGVAISTMMTDRADDPRAMGGMLLRVALLSLGAALILTRGLGLGQAAATFGAIGSNDRLFLFGLSKEGATLGWMLVTTGVAALGLLLFYYASDVKQSKIEPLGYLAKLGSVSLMAYLLQFVLFACSSVIGLNHLRFNAEVIHPIGSALIALAVTILICQISIYLAKKKIILHL